MGNDNSTIIRLEGPDRVRKRPANIFYSDGIEGVSKVITSLLDIFVTEASLGFSSNIRVNFHADNSISVRSFDRGFIFDETVINGHPAWYYDFCEIFPEPHEVVDNYRFSVRSKHNDLYGKVEIPMPKYQDDSDHAYNVSFVQYVSEFMHVESTRNGTKKMLDFKKGYNVSDLCKEQTFESSNTYIHFLIDHEVFNYTYLPTDEIAKFLKNAAITIPGLKCEICNEQDNSNHTFLYPNGSEDYAEEIINSAVIPLFIKEIEAKGKDRYNYKEYDARVKIVLGFANSSSILMCLHNHIELEYGGQHLDAVKERLLDYINWEFIGDFKDEPSPNDENNYCSWRRFELSFDDIKDNIVLILETNCAKYAYNYVNETGKFIKNRMITDMSYDLISKEFDCYLKENHEAIFSILKGIKHVG